MDLRRPVRQRTVAVTETLINPSSGIDVFTATYCRAALTTTGTFFSVP